MKIFFTASIPFFIPSSRRLSLPTPVANWKRDKIARLKTGKLDKNQNIEWWYLRFLSPTYLQNGDCGISHRRDQKAQTNKTLKTKVCTCSPSTFQWSPEGDKHHLRQRDSNHFSDTFFNINGLSSMSKPWRKTSNMKDIDISK